MKKTIITSTISLFVSSCSFVSEKVGQADSVAHVADEKMHKVDNVMHDVVSPAQKTQTADKK